MKDLLRNTPCYNHVFRLSEHDLKQNEFKPIYTTTSNFIIITFFIIYSSCFAYVDPVVYVYFFLLVCLFLGHVHFVVDHMYCSSGRCPYSLVDLVHNQKGRRRTLLSGFRQLSLLWT